MCALECVACLQKQDSFFGHEGFQRVAFVAYAAFLGLGYNKLKARKDPIPFSRFLFGGHLFCVAAVFYSTLPPLTGFSWQLSDATHYDKSFVFLLGMILLALACVPLRTWVSTIATTSPLWLYACLAGLAAWAAGFPTRSLWNISGELPSHILQVVAFHSVLPLMHILLPNATSDAAHLTMGTPNFSIYIVGSCSGIEGLELVLVFASAWLWYFRKEIRLWRALLLVPCALACIWLLNIVRLTALVYIGSTFSPDVAMVGFHSQFGWISFTAVALAFSMAIQRLPWVRKLPAAESGQPAANETAERGESPATRAYLIPFLAILAAAFVSKAASGYFEWLYPLRFAAAFIALFYFRAELKKLDWRFGWLGPVAGVAVFLLWIAPDWAAHFLWGHPYAASPLGPALAALSPAARWSWIAVRVAAAVITVPVAEELAFRGYLARRLMNREFDEVPFQSLTALSVGLSSVAFGLMHGEHWFVGILAGLAYAGVLRWRGRMGDAVVAHAVSNLLLAVWVLGLGDWAQW